MEKTPRNLGGVGPQCPVWVRVSAWPLGGCRHTRPTVLAGLNGEQVAGCRDELVNAQQPALQTEGRP